MTQPPHKRILNFAARWFLAIVFAVAAASKLYDLNEFAQRVGDFGLVHDQLVTLVAWAIVAAELIVALALLLNARRGLLAAVLLLMVFVGVLSYGIVLGLDIECGCFGPAARVSLATQLLTDCGLLLVCVIIYWSRPPKLGPRGPDASH